MLWSSLFDKEITCPLKILYNLPLRTCVCVYVKRVEVYASLMVFLLYFIGVVRFSPSSQANFGNLYFFRKLSISSRFQTYCYNMNINIKYKLFISLYLYQDLHNY